MSRTCLRKYFLFVPAVMLLTDPALATERTIKIAGAEGAQIDATLTVPDTPGHHPAMLLVAGSGPTDRDGNQPNHRTMFLRSVAELLAQQGVASLRYDKRGIGQSTAIPADAKTARNFLAWDNFVDDAKAALAALRSDPSVDPARVGIFGHSEGGLIALAVAVGTTPPPTMLVLASTPGRPVSVVLRDQLDGVMARRGTPADRRSATLDAEDRITASLRDQDQLPADVPSGLAPLFPPSLIDFWHGELAIDPATQATRFAGPVLILQGEADPKVSPDKDARALLTVLRSRTGGVQQLSLIPGTGHLPLDLSATPGEAPAIAAPARSALIDWIDRRLTSPKPTG